MRKSIFLSSDALAAMKLSVCWLLGLLFGGYLAAKTPAVDAGFVTVASTGMTVLTSALVLLFPLLISVLLGYLFSPDSVLAAVFIKAVTFAIVCVSCVLGCGSAGWIISGLLLFSDFLGISVLLWFWYSILCGRLQKKHIFVSAAFILMISFTDCYIISPFLCSLF